MSVYGIRGLEPTQTQQVGAANYTRRAQDEPVKEGVKNFEGRKDADTFEKQGSNVVRNTAIGTGIAALALYATAVILGRGKAKGNMEWLTKNADKGIKKHLNTVVDAAYSSAKWVKSKTWDPIANLFKKKGGDGDGGAAGA